jgi:hypothetical protein
LFAPFSPFSLCHLHSVSFPSPSSIRFAA